MATKTTQMRRRNTSRGISSYGYTLIGHIESWVQEFEDPNRKAADAGNANAMKPKPLALHTWLAKGSAQDSGQAFAWFQKAADAWR
jgi:hypothetical protein